MKSTMKSAFAFIAVALMIMVAVVPMVGVFTEDSSATTTVDPATDKNEIGLKVNVVGAGSSDKVKIAYGSYAFYSAIAGDTAEFTIREASVASLTISCVNEDNVKINDFPEVKLTNLVANNSYEATLRSGYKSQEVEFVFADESKSIGGLLGEDLTTTASYVVYADETAKEKISEGKVTIGNDSKGTIQVPAGTTGDVYIKVEKFDKFTNVTFTNQKIAIESTVQKIKAEQTLITITPSSDVISVVKITSLKATYTADEDKKYVTFKAIKDTMVHIDGTAYSAYFVEKLPADITVTGYEATLFADDSSADDVWTDDAADITYSPKGAFFGTIKMREYAQEGTLIAKIKNDAGTESVSVSVKVDASGNFFKFIKSSGTETKITDISFTSNNVKFTPTTSYDYNGTTALTFVVPGDGYSEVKGALKYKVNIDEMSVVDKTLTITGAKTFGSLVTKDDGSFAFMAESGKNVIVSAADSKLYGAISIVPGENTGGLKIFMETQTITLKVADALGNPITTGATVKLMDGVKEIATFTAPATETVVYKAVIRGDLTPTKYTVLIAKDGLTFDVAKEAPAFVEGSTYKAYDAPYELKFYNNDGKALDPQPSADTNYEVYVAKAYKNTLGSIIYTYEGLVSAESGKYVVKASLLGVKESSIGTTPVDVLILKNKSLTGVFKDYYYLLDADDKGVISITASVDSFTGKLVRNDGVTPVSGIEVKLNDGSADVADATTYTQTDGSFTLYSDSKITSSYKVKFVAADSSGYTFDEEYDTFKGEVRNAIFKAKTSAYTITFIDADDAKIELAGTPKVGGIDVTNVTGNVAKLTAGWTSKTDALAISDVTDRSFIDHTLTAEELASGEITVKSNQKTYTFTVKDANGVAPTGTTAIYYYKYVGDIPTTETPVPTTKKILLPVAGDDLDTVYGYKVMNGEKYAFETAVTKITDVKIDIKSTSAMKTVSLQDAAGVALTKSTGTVTIYEDGVALPASVGITKGSFKFVATKDVVYTYAFTDVDGYTFAENVKDVDGVVKAKEETIYGKVTDAAGKYFGITVRAIKAYDANGEVTGSTATQEGTDTSFSIIAEKSKIAYYRVDPVPVPSSSVEFTFEDSKTADIKAVETFVPFTFVSANNKVAGLDGAAYTIGVIDKLGFQTPMTKVAVNGVDGIVLDTTDVVSYSVTFTSGTSDGYFTVGTYTSVNGAFVSDVAEYKGKLGATYATGDVLEYAVYKGNELVLRKNINVVGDDKTVYSANINKALGDKVIITFKKGADVYTAVMNDNVVYNDLVKVVVAPSLKANIVVEADYVDYELSADKTKVYLIANESYSADATSSTGEKLVEKFVFDGWYVNGEKVSSKLNYTVDNVDSNVVMANYVSDGYYEIDKPVQNDNGVSPTVLAIGIAAVIVALIAVVYTVIQKKE